MAGLRGWKKALKDAMYYSWENRMDTDHPDCPQCGSTMDFHGHDDSGDFPIGEGYWECPGCGFKVIESEL